MKATGVCLALLVLAAVIAVPGTGTAIAAGISGTGTENGSPLEDAQIWVFGPGGRAVLSNETGDYALEVPGGTYYVDVFAPGRDAFIGEQKVILSPDDTAVADFDFLPAVVRGTITENGVPLEGAIVAFPAGIQTTWTYTSESGEYYKRVQSGTRQRVRVWTPGGEAIIGGQWLTLELGEDFVFEFDFVPCTITGTVTKDGNPVAGARIALTLCDPWGVEWMSTFADADGRYSQRIQTGSPYLFTAQSPDGTIIIDQKMVTADGTQCPLVLNFPPSVDALAEIDPDTLNLKSKGKWITCYIALPDGYDIVLPDDYGPGDIDVDTVLLENVIAASRSEIQNGVLMVKFDRGNVIRWIEGLGATPPTEVTLTVTGRVDGRVDGVPPDLVVPFEASDTIRVLKKGK